MYTGTQEERGLLAWGQSSEDSKDKPLSSDYEEGYVCIQGHKKKEGY